MENFYLIILLVIIIAFLIYYFKTFRVDYRSFVRRGFRSSDNNFGLICYTGKQGTGKTYSCIHYLVRTLPKDFVIITNVLSLSRALGCVYLKDIRDIINYCEQNYETENLCVFYDEIFTVIEKNRHLGKEILSFISQLRKRGIIFVTTAQEWSEINITLRRYVRFQVSCRCVHLPFTTLFLNSVHDGDTMRWNNDAQEFQCDLLHINVHKGNKYITEIYDTYETIDTM